MADVFPPVGSQYPLVLPAPLRPGALQNLVSSRPSIQQHWESCFERLSYLAECQATFNESERVPELEEALCDLIDVQRDAEHMKEAVLATNASIALAMTSTADPARAIYERAEVLKTNYRDLTPLQKYAHARPYDEFKRRVFDIERPDEDYPGAASFFKTARENGDDEEEEELEMTYHSKRNLKCPITMMTLRNPVRSKVCVHVFSRDAVMEMLRGNRGVIKCPVAGCDKRIQGTDLERDRVMERRVRDEEEQEERQGEALSSDVGEDILDIL